MRCLQKGSIGWIPKVDSTFGSDARIVRKSGRGFPHRTMRRFRQRASDGSQKWIPLLGPMLYAAERPGREKLTFWIELA
jgi:hypothetical protein